MADMASTMTEPMNSRLKKDYAAKANNLGSYYNQLYGKDNSAASVGSGSAASAGSYSNYLSNANAQLKKQKNRTSGAASSQLTASKPVNSGMVNNAKTTIQNKTASMTAGQQNTGGTSANNDLYSKLSTYDQKLKPEAQATIVDAKQRWQEANAIGNKAAMQDAYVDAQLARAMYGGYIDNVGDGSGYAAFGYGNLSAADRAMSQEDQDQILKLKLLWKYADNDADRNYYASAANKIRSKYGYTSTDGTDYIKNDLLTTPYEGYQGGEFTDGGTVGSSNDSYVDTYTDRMNQINDYIMNRKYDPETDPAYQAYKAQYERNASAAANAALAQAAGNTGGIANSYAMALSNAAQQSYMKQLTDVIPTLQQQDYADRLSLLNALGQQQSSAYDRYNTDRNFSYDTWLKNWENAYNMAQLEWEKQREETSRNWQTEENQRDRDWNEYMAKLGY